MRRTSHATGGVPPIVKVIGGVVILIVAAALGIPLTGGSGGGGSAGGGAGGVSGPAFETGPRLQMSPDGTPGGPGGAGPGATAEDEDDRGGGVSAPAPAVGEGLAELRRLIADRASGEMVTVTAEVFRVLEDDNDGSRHQRFLIAVGRDGRRTLTVKVSHNIDLAPRVPAEEGDVITVRGEFEWNDLGGVIHWTHHDPGGRRAGGWIEFDGRRYE